MSPELRERLAGVLLGTALGDALGLPTEGMSPNEIRRRFGRVERFHMLGRTGYVSDDTEQSALVAQSLLRTCGRVEGLAGAFGTSLLGWFLRLPWGVGLGTVRACVKLALRWRPSGVFTAGNGSAMRAAVVGVFFRDRPEARLECGRELSEVSHRDPRAIEGALFVAELAAQCAAGQPSDDRFALWDRALAPVREPSLVQALARARELAQANAPAAEAAAALGTTGFVVHTVAFAGWCFLAHGHAPLAAIGEAVRAGGDTDSIAAIAGAWCGALHGEAGLPADLVANLHDGPFGPSHLRALAAALAALHAGAPFEVPRYSVAGALARNLALFPVVVAHVVRRWLPF